MSQTIKTFLLLAAVLLGSVREAAAQEPKPGADWYEDSVDIGFKFKAPDGWGFVPAQPGEVGGIGRYVGPSGQYLLSSAAQRKWNYTLFVIAFDRRTPTEEDSSKPKFGKAPTSVPEWVEDNLSEFSMKKTDEHPDRSGKLDTIEYTFEGMLGPDCELGLFVTLFKLHPDVDVALAFNGPGGRNWSKFERAFKKICSTMRPLEVAGKSASATAGGSLRDKKRADLQNEMSKSPGWELYETPNYFIVSSNPDRGFVKELLDRLEAIREVYEVIYSPKMAEELRRNALVKRRSQETGGGKEDAEPADDEEEEDPEPDEDSAVAMAADPMERSRTCVVRVCKDRDEYQKYGGPPGTAGYWSPMQGELVVFDDKAVGGRGNTWATLNHEAFHQYIFYFFGNMTPHYWYNEGTGDFYAGYEYKNKKFTLKPFDWRVQTIQQLVSKKPPLHVPLKEFVRYDRAKYYDPKTIGENYAQGWALIWFLRTGKKQARCWDDSWDTILDTYLRVLVETDDLDTAVDEAFAGVDWQKFEDCWKQYTLQ